MGRQIKDQPWTGHDQFVAMKEAGPPTRIVTIGGTSVNVSQLANDTRFNNNDLRGATFGSSSRLDGEFALFADLAGTDMQVTSRDSMSCTRPVSSK